MRIERSVISNKGLVTLPKDWRDKHNLDESSEVEIIFKEKGGPLLIMPKGYAPTDLLEDACIKYMEKGLNKQEIEEAHKVITLFGAGLKEAQDAFI